MMFTIIVALCLFTLTSSLPLTNRIINGTKVQDYTWIADILTYYEVNSQYIELSRNCGGSLVARNWVLTARHCIYTEEENLASEEFHVSVGSNSIFSGQVKKVVDIIKYNQDHEDDVILLKLESDVVGIKPVKVQYEDNIDYTGKMATIYGWGTTETGEQVGDLRQTNVELISREECGESRWVCFDPKRTNSNACGGDSGGPMVLEVNGEIRLIGVTHGGIVGPPSQTPCDSPRTFYMSTAHYASWIQSIIG